MNEEIKKLILDEIKASDTILIARHFRPDGDAIGSTKGFQRILKLSFPDKDIRLCNRDYSDYMAFLGPEDELSVSFAVPLFVSKMGEILWRKNRLSSFRTLAFSTMPRRSPRCLTSI